MKTIKNKLYKINNLIVFVILLALIAIMVFPTLFVKISILKPVKIGTEKLDVLPSRYMEEELEKSIYRDVSGREYSIKFDETLPEETLLSYEEIISHKSRISKGGIPGDLNKDLYIAETKSVPNLNYELRYRNLYSWKGELDNQMLTLANTDSTITQNENVRLARLWNTLGLGKYFEITNEEKIFENNNNLFSVGEIFATTNTLALYKRNPKILSVGNGINAGEAYVMVANRNQSVNLDVDKNQQALWLANGSVTSIDNIPNTYLGLNPEANIVGDNIGAEAEAIRDYAQAVENFKETHRIDGLETEMYDNMWKNYYESGLAGVVGYDDAKSEYLVGPFSIDYVRNVYVPIIGGQNENQTNNGIILFNSIKSAEIYGLNNNGIEEKLTDWEFIYPDVEYDVNTKAAKRIAETTAVESGDTALNAYPYPNENFYIKFKNPDIQCITKFEFVTASMNAEAEVYLYEGKSYNVSWKGALKNGKSYLQMTPSWTDIKENNITGTEAADVYQVKSAEIFVQEKKFTISVGKYHEAYNNYCIPITMELAGNVWYDGTEVEQVKNPNKVFGIRDKNEKGMKGVNVILYNEDDKKIAETITDDNGNYVFKYVKLGPKYYIEFEYDGMKYKATTYLNNDSSNNEYKNPNEFSRYFNASHIKEDSSEREEYNNSFTEIKNGNSKITGEAISGSEEVKDIKYSTLSSNNEDKYIGATADINRYNFSSITKTTGLSYPLQGIYIITNKDLSVIDKNQGAIEGNNLFALGKRNIIKNSNYIIKIKNETQTSIIETTNSYVMIDEQLHNINLGLIERAPIDFAIKNDVVQTTLTFVDDEPEVNILDYGKRSIDENNFDITSRYKTGDSNYFNETYSENIDYDKYIWKNVFTTNINSLENDNAQVYVQYKVRVRNQADVTSGYITELVNYYDEDLYYPVDSNEMWKYYDTETNYVDNYEENGKLGYGNIVIPQIGSLTSWAIKNPDSQLKEELGKVEWNSSSKFEENTVSQEASGLRTMYTNSLSDIILNPNEYIDIYIIYKVELKENAALSSGVYISNDNATTGKRNIIEINSYKALNINGSNGGRVDKDSAPGNSEIDNFVTYEDDIDQAPYLRLLVEGKTEGNSIVGYVWEDKKTETLKANNQKLGNGRIDYDVNTNESLENYINNVLVELIRLEYNQATGEYEEVRFTDEYKKAFPEKYDSMYSNVLETLIKDPNAVLSWTGPNSSNKNTLKPLTNGQYRFDNLVSGGTYKVRFRYGTEEQLRTEFSNYNTKIYNGHDYRTTVSNGRINIADIEPSTEIYYLVDSYEIIKNNENNEKNIIKNLKNINAQLTSINGNIKTNIVSYGAENYNVCSNFDEIIESTAGNTVYSINDSISNIKSELESMERLNKIVVIYNNGGDSNAPDAKENILEMLDAGITVIGIGYDMESLNLYKLGTDDKKVDIYKLDSNMERNILETIKKQVEENHYLLKDCSHAEDYIKNISYSTMDDYSKSVTGRLEVMQYSQETDPIIADSLNIQYIKTLVPEPNLDSEWSNRIKLLAEKTQMTADSYEVTFTDVNEGEKILNLGLEEIPKRTLEVTNEVDDIVIRLANGRKLIDLSAGINKNVQEIPDRLFSIYMDEDIMQGATIEITYKINISNIGEVDNLYSYVRYATHSEKRNWLKALTGVDFSVDLENQMSDYLLKTEPIKVSKIYNYFDNLIFRAEDNNRWGILNKTVKTNENLEVARDEYGKLIYLNEINVYDNRKDIRKERVVWEMVNKEDVEVLDRIQDLNKENFNDISVIETTSLNNIELYPNNSKEVIDNINASNRPISTVCTYLILSKTLAANDMESKDVLNYRNCTEIIETTSNIGRRDYNGVEGNFNGNLSEDNYENDIDNAERVSILPPFGDKKIMFGVIIVELSIIAIGIIFIKRKK